MKLSIVVPAYNEKATIREIVARVQAVDLGGLEREIVIVRVLHGARDAAALAKESGFRG